MKVGVIGSGAMGTGIAQVAAMASCVVVVYDNNLSALDKSKASLDATFAKLEGKGKLPDAKAVMARLSFTNSLSGLADCALVIEAIVEHLEVKKQLFASLEAQVGEGCILATNTSSLSVTAIAAACVKPERVLGLHFFNPPPLMALVEVVPAIQTSPEVAKLANQIMMDWGKTPVIAKDTPGFIVNRVARPFYGEALRIYEEGIADIATIDWAMTTFGGYRMGPFTLMDYIGHDVNYVVTETVFTSFFFDPRYKPSFSQKRLLEAGWLGRKSGKGFYDYSSPEPQKTAIEDAALGLEIVDRINAMLINEAVDALYLKVATAADLELAMTKGVNYPQGLLALADSWGVARVLTVLDELYRKYGEDRYRASALLRRAASEGATILN
ncbi:MAG: 3-hydroxybutyryl-CoA dehydrogenase [Bacteroidetes bacterium]|nr:3-hydroxybutyryl-CoA dehydrogenase [Bacteroidota bacterium]